METTTLRVVILGAGNVATHIAQTLAQRPSIQLIQIYSRSYTSAQRLVAALSVGGKGSDRAIPQPLNQLNELNLSADFYIFALPDAVLPTLWQAMPKTSGIWLHTAGSVGLGAMADHHTEAGVLYPLQTFSREKAIDFGQIPLYIEGATPEVEEQIDRFAHELSPLVYKADSQARRALHIAAVMACNFTNHLIALSEEWLQEHHLPAKALLPLISETVEKLHHMPAREAQTGPAIRGDEPTLQSHLSMLQGRPKLQEIYHLLSQSIQDS